ncbi:MAG: FHA domain-containing protein [Phycisphaerales bacterium]|nr:FHA domain-containing protein [Phycisphaerales bacterium]
MAYLIFADRKGELARHELAGPVTVGRANECSIAVHDALLSRRHCRIEPMLDQWVITDLGSKNGTFIDNQRVSRQTLRDGDIIRIGRTRVCFRAGPFVPAPPSNRPADFRPIDPIEALAGTVAGFRLEPTPAVDTSGFPRPQPRPAEPHSATSDEAHSLVTGLSSSAWDELLAAGATVRPGSNRPRPKVSVKSRRPEPHAPHPQTDAPPRRLLNPRNDRNPRSMSIVRLLATACAAVMIVITLMMVLAHYHP